MKRASSTLFAKTGLLGLFLFVGMRLALADISGGTNDPKLLFQRMLDAQTSLMFSGSVAYEDGENLTSYSVDSRYLEGDRQQTLATLNGPKKIYRLSKKNRCSDIKQSFADHLSNWYNFSFLGTSRVAGRDGYKILLRPVDPFRLGYEFVVDQGTGLMLRSTIMLPDRRTVERVQFVDINIAPEELNKRATQTNAHQTHLSAACDDDETSSPWRLNWVPTGFKQLRYQPEKTQDTYLFGDGLSTFSLFVKPIDSVTIPPGVAQKGATALVVNYISVQDQIYLVTFVGELPKETGSRILSSLSVQ